MLHNSFHERFPRFTQLENSIENLERLRAVGKVQKLCLDFWVAFIISSHQYEAKVGKIKQNEKSNNTAN